MSKTRKYYSFKEIWGKTFKDTWTKQRIMLLIIRTLARTFGRMLQRTFSLLRRSLDYISENSNFIEKMFCEIWIKEKLRVEGDCLDDIISRILIHKRFNRFKWNDKQDDTIYGHRNIDNIIRCNLYSEYTKVFRWITCYTLYYAVIQKQYSHKIKEILVFSF